jgi:hypothetical protein
MLLKGFPELLRLSGIAADFASHRFASITRHYWATYKHYEQLF